MTSDPLPDDDAGTRDAEKRWHDPQALRAALVYVVFVTALVIAAFAATTRWHSLIAGILVPVIAFVGAMGAWVRCYQVWRDDGVWVIWQGAGWILVVLFMFCLGVPAGVQ